jgi:DNA excision repair protein ERCC-4
MVECTVIIDSREYETAEEVVKWLKRFNCSVIPRKLDIGDYVLPGNVGIERKRAMDFISSIVDGRLFEQARELLRAFDRAYIIVEGDLWRSLTRREVHEHSILGSLATLVDMGLRIIPTPSEEGTAYVIKSMAEKVGNRGIKSIPIRKGGTIKDLQIQFLSSLPGIGQKRAEAILKVFGTPLDALNNLGQWTRKVDGINENVVNVVRKILTMKYGEEVDSNIILINEAFRIDEGTDRVGNEDGSKGKFNKRNITDYLGDDS